MSMTAVIPYFRTIMKDVMGFQEHKDPFNIENNPSTYINKSFHVELGDASFIKQSQNAIEMTIPASVRFWYKGTKEPWLARDSAVQSAETLIKKALAPGRRLTGSLKNVTLSSVSHQALSLSNDNVIETKVDFQTMVILSPDPETGPTS